MDNAALLLPPVFGAGIGLLTNALAIRMLFRPYREIRIFGLRFQGTIPRRKTDIAHTVSQVVTSELLREEQVARRIAGPEVRAALRELVLTVAQRYQGRLQGSLADALTAPQQKALKEFLQRFLIDLAELAGRWLAGAEGRAAVKELLSRVAELSPADLLHGEERVVREAVTAHVNRVLEDPGLEERLRPLVAWALVRFAGSGRTLDELLPPQFGQAMCGVLRGATPELLRRFEAALLAPANVSRLKRAVRGGIRRYLAETEGGVVKNLIRQAALLGQERILREADQVVDANLHRLGELVHEEGNRARVEEGVEEAVLALLRQTPAELLASLPAETVDGAHDQLAIWLAAYLRRPAARSFVDRLVGEEFERLFHLPLRELVSAATPQSQRSEDPISRLADGLCEWLCNGGLATLVDQEGPVWVRAVVHTPLSGGSRLLAPTVVEEVADLSLDQLLPVLAARIPEILRVIDVQGLVEREILAFAPEDVERVILTVARKELRAITWWGAVLGGLVGTLQSALHYFAK